MDLLFPEGAAAAGSGAGVVAAGPNTGCTAILRGALPTAMVAVTVRLAKSTTETSLEPSSVTKAVRPSELDALQCGVLPTATVPASVLFAVFRIPSSPRPRTNASAHRASGAHGRR